MSEAIPMYVSASRGTRRNAYFLLTPENYFAARLPGLSGTVVQKLVTPRVGTARFAQYLLEIEAGEGTTAPIRPGFENFFYTLEGRVELALGDVRHPVETGGFAYAPPETPVGLRATTSARLLWIKRRYEVVEEDSPPAALVAAREEIPEAGTSVPGLTRRELLPPNDPRHDFNISLLRFAPGTLFRKVEIHDEEHGLYMIEGQGIYYLDGDFHEVRQGDFIYMAPYCPQYFYAAGSEPTEYLLYKDAWRDGF